MSSDSRRWPGVSLPLHLHLIAWLSYWIIFLRTHLPTASPSARLGSGIRLLGTWFPLVSRETVVITTASVWRCHIWCLSHLSNTDIITLSSSKVQFPCSLVMRCSSSQEHIICLFCQLTAWPPLFVCGAAGAAVGACPAGVFTKRQEQKWHHYCFGLQRHHGHHQTPHADSICRGEPGFSEFQNFF